MLLRWLISKLRRKPENGAVVPEKWESSFRKPAKERFVSEEEEKFRAVVEKGHLALELDSRNLFAWSLNPVYRYRNFVMDISFSFDPDNGHSAAGALFRYVSQENYYYALLSRDGHFRFDVVFNGNPITLIPWMEVEPVGPKEMITFRVVAHESSFAFFIDGEWIAELDDDMIDTGYVAFAGQNYDEKEQARFYLHHYVIESRPMEVEVLYQRWVNYLEPDVERRMSLARRLYEMEQYTAALIQLKKAFRSREPAPQERFFLAETLINLRMYEGALQQVEKCLEAEPDFREAEVEKANLLYLMNRFIETREWIESVSDEFTTHAPLQNLLGNAEFSMGNWEAAAKSYEEAVRIDPEMPIFACNAARSWDYAGKLEKAKVLYRQAALGLFRQDAYEDLLPIRVRMRELDPADLQMMAIEGKVRFQEGNLPEAERIFLELIETGAAESDVCFLEGVIKMQRGETAEAVDFLRSAAEMEPDFHLYRLRLAEALHITGEPADEELGRSLELKEDDGWTCNLAGLIALERGENEKAKNYLERAYSRLAEEQEVQLNYSAALFRCEGLESAESVLRGGDDPHILNHRGNLYADAEDLERAVELYRKALEQLPDDPVFLENMASTLMRLERIAEAEEYVVRLLDTGGKLTVRAYEMIARIAMEKGEFERAATTLEEALKIEAENSGIRLDLARLLTRRQQWERARAHLERLLGMEESGGSTGADGADGADGVEGAAEKTAEEKEAESLLEQVRDATETRYVCSSCGREWRVPKDADAPERVRLYGEPPKESPAGQCESCGRVYCVECALKHMEGNRFVCSRCGVKLKLSDAGLKYLAVLYANREHQ